MTLAATRVRCAGRGPDRVGARPRRRRARCQNSGVVSGRGSRSPYPGKVHLPPPVRRPEGSCREAHIPTKHPPPFQEARLPCSDGHCRRPGDSQGPSGQGSLQAVGLIRLPFFETSRTLSGARPTLPQPAPSRRLGRVHGPGRFRTLQRSRVRARSGPLNVTWSPRPTGPDEDGVCVAYAIPTSVGNAVQRNTVRRRLRHAFTANAAAMPSGDVLVRVIAPAGACTWPEVTLAVAEVTRRIARQTMPAGGEA